MFQINEGSQVCSSCGTKLSEYFCFKCKHFTGVHKNPFHCDKCGICRYVVSVLPFNALSVYVLLSTCLLICLFTCLSVFCLFVCLFQKGLCTKNLHALLRLPDSNTDSIKQTCAQKIKPDWRMQTCKLPQTARSRQLTLTL